MYIKMLIFADSLFVESVTVKFRKYGEISVLYLCLLFFVFHIRSHIYMYLFQSILICSKDCFGVSFPFGIFSLSSFSNWL